MKVLILAPKICTPWTEGRKKFVSDLIEASHTRWELCGLLTVDAGESNELAENFTSLLANNRKDHLLLLVRGLKQAIRKYKPDLVCHFPFGAFSGVRGLANLWAISKVAGICRALEAPCCTCMYSLTSEANSWLHHWLLKDVYFNQYAGNKKRIRFGVKLPAANVDRTKISDSRTLLFMSGAAEASTERLDYVLDVRGLRLLLKAGRVLSSLGYKLIVAIPFLQSRQMQQLLLDHSDNSWEQNQLELRAEVRVPDIFAGVAGFVFPYGQEEQQFVPTSIIEAMHFGVPVVLPKLGFLVQFYAGAEKALIYSPGDSDGLIAQIKRLESDADGVSNIRNKALDFVADEYSITNTVLDIEAIYQGLKV